MNWFHLFTLVLLIGKVAGYLTIGWLWVFAPSIFAIAFAALIMGLAGTAIFFSRK